jgi:hypothetical protein
MTDVMDEDLSDITTEAMVAAVKREIALRIPPEVLANHVAILGKTGSGKTSTEKLAVEEVAGEGFRVCVLDSVKSDWWGITSSADGKKPGLPFKILGGPRGHVPLHSSAGKVIGQLVGSGKLPLSIIDMADFEPGGLQRFFIDFAQALMRHARGVLYLVIEEAHEFAPKDRTNIGNENLAIHWTKKLATAGRSKGIRLIVATQRIQALHNAVLGSCETVITHRLTAPADQEPVLKWLKANTDKETQEKVAASLSSLPTGTGWLCSGEARIFEQIAFPKFKTYDNTATPIADGEEITVKTAPVDQDELRAIIGDAVKEAEASDPKLLRNEIARLTAELAKKPQTVAAAPDPAAVEQARQEGYHDGWTAGCAEGEARGAIKGQAVMLARAQNALNGLRVDDAPRAPEKPQDGRSPPLAHRAVKPAPASVAPTQPPARVDIPRTVVNGEAVAITGAQQRILNALAWWSAFGIEQPTNEQLGFVAGYSPGSGNFNNLKGGLRSSGLIDYPSGGRITLTDAGRAAAEPSTLDVTQAAFHAQVRAKLSRAQLRLFEPILAAYPDTLSSDEVAEAAGYSVGSGNFNNLRGGLRTIGLIDYPMSGQVRAADWLFP